MILQTQPLRYFEGYGPAKGWVDAPDIKVIAERPWLLELWEPLRTKAPSPAICQPYCCYSNTVIFYARPYVVRPWHHFWICNGERRAEKPGQHFEEYDQVESRLRWDTLIQWNGEYFEVHGGEVVWRQKRWWMRHGARRGRAERRFAAAQFSADAAQRHRHSWRCERGTARSGCATVPESRGPE
jgi:hypothetical protein